MTAVRDTHERSATCWVSSTGSAGALAGQSAAARTNSAPESGRSVVHRPLQLVSLERSPRGEQGQQDSLQLDDYAHLFGQRQGAMRDVQRLLSAAQRVQELR